MKGGGMSQAWYDPSSKWVRRVTARNDPRVTREGLSVIPLGHQTYLAAKAKGENSMSGKAEYGETA